MLEFLDGFLNLLGMFFESPKIAAVTLVGMIGVGALIWGIFKLCEGNATIAQYGPFVAVGIGIGFLIFAVYEAAKP